MIVECPIFGENRTNHPKNDKLDDLLYNKLQLLGDDNFVIHSINADYETATAQICVYDSQGYEYFLNVYANNDGLFAIDENEIDWRLDDAGFFRILWEQMRNCANELEPGAR